MPQNFHRLMVFFLVFLTSIWACSCTVEKKDHFLEDRAGILSSGERDRISRYNKLLLNELDIHFKLLILDKRADDINRLAADAFKTLGAATKGAKGLLFMVDPIGEQVRIEVGYDLEAVFPDIFVGYLEKEQMAPFFQVGRIGAGIEATSELFVARMEEAVEGKAFDPASIPIHLQHYSGGGGARLAIGFNSGVLDKKPVAGGYDAQDTPEEALQAYKRVLRDHVKDPDLPLFTPQTRIFFSKWVVTNGQQDNELRTLEKSPPEQIVVSGAYAVIRYPVSHRTQAPYFLQKGDNGWMLDMATMSQVMQMNHRNMWMFKSMDHPFMFAFKDWSFDKNGFPIVQQ